MNDHDLLEHELNSLGKELRKPPSIARAVLATIAHDSIESSLLGASAGVRGPLPVQRKTPQAQTRRFRDLLRPRWLASATALSVALAVAFLAVLLLRPEGVAFGQIQERLAAVRTASFAFRHSVERRLPNGESTSIDIQRHVVVRSDGRIRMEEPGGKTTLVSPDDFIKLELDTKKQTATLRYLYQIEQPVDLLTTLRTLHKSIVAVKIPDKSIQGVSCPGFRIEERHSTLLVWVDPKTRLPRSAERSYAKALREPGGDALQMKDTYDDLKFDEVVADDLFDLSPPAGYAVTTIGTPPADRKELFAEPLVVTPRVGVGPLKFGMSKAEILQQLGKPDATEIRVPQIELSDKITDVDGRPRPPGAALVVLTELHILTFNALGLRLTIEVDEGLRGIQCLGQDSVGPEGRSFRGATEKGIRIGSSKQEVIKAYGPADDHPSAAMLSYSKLDVLFSLGEQQTVRIINVDAAGEHPLRFEWREPIK